MTSEQWERLKERLRDLSAVSLQCSIHIFVIVQLDVVANIGKYKYSQIPVAIHYSTMSKKSISSENTETRSIASTLELVKSKTKDLLFGANSSKNNMKQRKYDEKSTDSYEAKAAYMAIR